MASVISGTFTGTGVSASGARKNEFPISLSGFGTATVVLQKSYDEGSTWKTVKSYSADVEEVANEPEAGIVYRFNCTSHGGGTIAYRLGPSSVLLGLF